MLSLLRNPLLRLVGRFWWVPALGPFAGEGLGGETGNRIATSGVEVYLGTVATLVGLACAHGAAASVRWRGARWRLHNGYLCPHCLQLGAYHFGCGACGEEVEEFPSVTRGIYVNDCPQCKATLFQKPGRPEGIVKAFCGHCGQNSDRTIHHERRVRVIGTFHRDDFAALSTAIHAEMTTAGEVAYAIQDDGRQLTYVLSIGDILDKMVDIPREHALFHPDAIWCNQAAVDPLNLGREVDRYISQAGMSKDRLKSVRICVAQDSLDSATSRRLEAPFRTVSYGVAASEFAGDSLGEVPAASSTAGPSQAASAREQQADSATQTLGR